MSSAKRYAQYCPVARSLDVLGERWTLLVVRSLLMGPQRYTDLRAALPGIATDLLTARLRTLAEAGYLRHRRLPRPAPVSVYELTDSGQALAPAILVLARLGMARLGTPGREEDVTAEPLVLSLRASFRREATDGEVSYQLDLDGEPFTVNVRPDWAETLRGPASEAAVRLVTATRTLAELLSGAKELKAAVADGSLEVDGPPAAARRFLQTFSYPATATAGLRPSSPERTNTHSG